MTLRDILKVSCSEVTIMTNKIFPILTVSPVHMTTNLINQDILESEIRKMISDNNQIKVWLEIKED